MRSPSPEILRPCRALRGLIGGGRQFQETLGESFGPRRFLPMCAWGASEYRQSRGPVWRVRRHLEGLGVGHLFDHLVTNFSEKADGAFPHEHVVVGNDNASRTFTNSVDLTVDTYGSKWSSQDLSVLSGRSTARSGMALLAEILKATW